MNQDQKHLTVRQIELLVEVHWAGAKLPQDAELLAHARRHLASCNTCQGLVSMHVKFGLTLEHLKLGFVKDATSDCPPEGYLNELAAGLVLPDDAEQILRHTMNCDHCGPLFRQATKIFSPDKGPDEVKVLSSLKSGQSEWQERLAQKLAGNSAVRVEGIPASRLEIARSFPIAVRNSWLYAVVAAIAVCTIIITSLLWRSRPGYADQLLAEAYTEHRTLEVRIPGAKYAPIRVERGGSTSSLDKPASLLKAEILIVENLSKNPDDARWLESKGRADLLDGNFESAIHSLQRALEMQPDSTTLLTDLGSAYFLRAEVLNRAIDYGNAIESLSKGLAKSPDDPVSLFNRALACERLFLYNRAIDDWEHYLRIDASGDWSKDARANLQRVKQKIEEREKRSAIPLLSPEAYSATIDSNHVFAVSSLDQRSEQYLEIAIHSWLPQIYGDGNSAKGTAAEAGRALEYLASILKDRHDDSWLNDFLKIPRSAVEKQGVQSLLGSIEALQSGQYGLSAELAQKSARDFQHSKNRAGMVRASFALMLAQSFELKYEDCLRTAAASIPLLSRYRWLLVQTLVQQAECQDALAREEDAIRSASRGTEIAKRFNYPGLELRAIAFEAEYRRDTGSADRGLHDLIKGLATFWQSDVSNTRGENLYSVLFNIAGTRNWNHVEAFAIGEKIINFPVRDPVEQAVSQELLAGAEERAGDYKAAEAALQSAAALLTTVPEDSGIILRKAEVGLEKAAIQLQLGDPEGAAATLADLRAQFETADRGLFQAEYFKTYGETYLTLGLNASAEPMLERALTVTETGLRNLRLESDKLQWSRLEGQIYRDLLEIKLKSGNPADSLALWEWYKGASLRDAVVDYSGVSGDGHMFEPPKATSYVLPPGTAVISYAVLKNSATVFVFRDGNVLTHVLPLSGGGKLHVLRFLRLCTDPSVHLNSLDAESRRLYKILLAPIESDIKGATALRFETDGILDRIPFDLLRGADGRYLADRFAVTYSPGLAYRSDSQFEPLTPTSTALIVVAPEARQPYMVPLPEASEEGKEVSSYFNEAKTLSGPQANRTEVLRNLGNTTVFHFVGHAVASVDQVGLLLGPDAVVNSSDLVNLRPRNLKLVVLSACDTAIGDEGTTADVNSLARTLAVAGVPQIVASRWKVDSAVTRQLMRAFYSNLMSGKSPADSLRAASAAVRNLPGYEHPYYWGSFAVFGTL